MDLTTIRKIIYIILNLQLLTVFIPLKSSPILNNDLIKLLSNKKCIECDLRDINLMHSSFEYSNLYKYIVIYTPW